MSEAGPDGEAEGEAIGEDGANQRAAPAPTARATPLAEPRPIPRDPLLLCALIALAFLLLGIIRIGVPAHGILDEGYYVPAAIDLLEGERVSNREHPMLGKTIIAAAMKVFGVNHVGWRIPSLFLMAGAILFAMRALWWYSRDNVAAVMFGLLLATGCLFNVLGRIALLDAPMLFFAAGGAFWLGKSRPTMAAIFFGLSLASKWTIAPLLPFVALMWAMRGTLSLRSLVREGLRFGLVPLAVYFLTFAPGMLVRENPLHPGELAHLQWAMLDFLTGYQRDNPYAARWWEWLANLRPYWPLAHGADGVWRFVILMVNPVSALFVGPAVLVALFRREHLWLVIFFAIPMALAALSDRTQYVHHYALPLAIGWALASLYLARLWHREKRWLAAAPIALAAAAFALYFPVLTAAEFDQEGDAAPYILLESWQYVGPGRTSAEPTPAQSAERDAAAFCLQQPVACRQ